MSDFFQYSFLIYSACSNAGSVSVNTDPDPPGLSSDTNSDPNGTVPYRSGLLKKKKNTKFTTSVVNLE